MQLRFLNLQCSPSPPDIRPYQADQSALYRTSVSDMCTLEIQEADVSFLCPPFCTVCNSSGSDTYGLSGADAYGLSSHRQPDILCGRIGDIFAAA